MQRIESVQERVLQVVEPQAQPAGETPESVEEADPANFPQIEEARRKPENRRTIA